jgi:arginine deiminase
VFDDVILVRRAQEEFDAFVEVMTGRGVEVLLFHDLLAEALQRDDAREWVLERRLPPRR